MSHFEIRGTDELSKALKELGKLDGVRNVVKKHGAQMQSSSQRFAPVDTGFLKQNIKLYIEDGGLTARVKSEADYAVYQEYGTRFQSGTPHIRPAFNKQRSPFISDMQKQLKSR